MSIMQKTPLTFKIKRMIRIECVRNAWKNYSQHLKVSHSVLMIRVFSLKQILNFH